MSESNGNGNSETIGEVHRPNAASLANLRPPWKPGESGNPKGRRTCGAVAREYLNSFAEQGLTLADMQAIIAEPTEPAVKVQAAMRMIEAAERGGLQP